jgi:hypothetical protein
LVDTFTCLSPSICPRCFMIRFHPVTNTGFTLPSAGWTEGSSNLWICQSMQGRKMAETWQFLRSCDGWQRLALNLPSPLSESTGIITCRFMNQPNRIKSKVNEQTYTPTYVPNICKEIILRTWTISRWDKKQWLKQQNIHDRSIKMYAVSFLFLGLDTIRSWFSAYNKQKSTEIIFYIYYNFICHTNIFMTMFVYKKISNLLLF